MLETMNMRVEFTHDFPTSDKEQHKAESFSFLTGSVLVKGCHSSSLTLELRKGKPDFRKYLKQIDLRRKQVAIFSLC